MIVCFYILLVQNYTEKYPELLQHFYIVTLQLILTHFSKHKLSAEELLHAEVADIPVRLLQSAGNIPKSCITAFPKVLLKPISVQYCSGSPNDFAKTVDTTLKI